ncbi:hypothetical protein K438DRAFT_1959042 [Mycena galopus ATCC 62051]|nr:hypothetical protein K438DRAFT_1959042 [Mycena galopus ATCC 62051]
MAFPLPQLSPIHAVLATFHNHEFTHRDLYPDSPAHAGELSPPSSSPCAGPSTFPGSLSSPTPPGHNVLIDPTLIDPALRSPKRRLDPASDPSLFAPRKRTWLLGVGMASTLSGSFLVTKAKATHLDIGKLATPVFECVPDHLREPDWSILQRTTTLPTYTCGGLEAQCESLEQELCDARNMLHAQGISEGQNAQIIALFEKEVGKKSDRTVLFPGGKGRHLTSDKVIAQKRALENAKAKEAADKVTKQTKREAKKAEKE